MCQRSLGTEIPYRKENDFKASVEELKTDSENSVSVSGPWNVQFYYAEYRKLT